MKIFTAAYNGGALQKKKGIELGPEAVLKKIPQFYLRENEQFSVMNIDHVKIDNKNIDDTNKAIEKAITDYDNKCILLGGDHSVTYPSFKAFAKRFENPGLLVFDAHLDCENSFSPPTHEDYLRVLIDENILKPQNVVVVGARNFHSNEVEFAKKHKLKRFDMSEISKEGIRTCMDAIMSVVRHFDGLYISVDIDVLDPAFAPGTGYTEPGGMTTRELLYCLQRIQLLKNIQMWDLVEVNPLKDLNELTVTTAAKLLVEMG